MSVETSIEDLRKRIVYLEEQVAHLYKHLGINFLTEENARDDPQVIEEIKRGNIIGAIKYYREGTQSGLAEAKRAVEEIQRRLRL